MKLRELLDRLGVLVRAHPDLYIKVVPIDRRRDDEFEIGWFDDADGRGPEYGYFPPDCESWDPYLFYEIPDEDEDNPWQLAGVTIDWDAEDWMVDRESWRRIVNGMENLQEQFDILKEAQK